MSSRDIGRGICWMLAAETVYVATWCAIKKLGGRLPLFEIVFFRAFFSLFVLLPLTYWRHRGFRARARWPLFLRSLFGFLAMFSSFYAMIHLRMGNASTLINTMPIFVALLATLLLHEPFGRRQFAFVLVAFVGIGLILKPDAGILEGPALIGLFSGVMSALAMIYLRRLHATDSTLIITLYFTAFSAACALPLAIRSFQMPTPVEWAWLVSIGTAITFAQLFMTRAYKFGHASSIAPFAYSAVILSYLAGLIFFEEVPDGWSLAGTAIIVASGVGVMLTAPMARRAEDFNSPDAP